MVRMISDALADAIKEIDRSLDEDTGKYTDDLRQRIIVVRDEMEALRYELETAQKA